MLKVTAKRTITSISLLMVTAAPLLSVSPQDTVKIVCFGDLFLGSWAVQAIDTNGADYPFRGTLSLIQSADLATANLEGPFTNHADTFLTKEYTLRVPPRMCNSLSQVGFQAVNLANNHILDFGFKGLEETFATLSAHNIKAFGAGLSSQDAYKPTVITLKSTKIAIVGYSTVFPEEFWANDHHGGTAFPFREQVEKALTAARDTADILLVQIHWGAEIRETPKDYQIELGRLFVDLGADLVIGHHAHIPLGVEIYKGVPIFYGLGNYAFASYSEHAKGMAVEAVFAGGNLVSVRIIPLNVNNVEVEFSPILLKNAEKQQFIQHIIILSNSLNPHPVIDSNGNLILSN